MEDVEATPTDRPSTVFSNPIKKKIDKLVSSKVHNDPEFVKLMDFVCPMVSDIDMHTERILTRKLEQRELDLNKEYLKEFERVNEHVQQFSSRVNDMHRICSDLTIRIQQNKEKTQDLLSKTSALQHRRKVLESKQKAIDDFLGRFSLSDAEEKALLGNVTDGTISSDFFPALERAKTIYEESKQLLRTTANHSAAMAVMEEMSQKMEAAYEVLYRSIQRECRVLNTEMVEVRGVLCESFAALKDREVLLKYALDEYTSARKNHILRVFLDALTRGHGMGKPIELLSHDPLRYIGDMLAWIYESVESERDLLVLLLRSLPTDLSKKYGTGVLSNISSSLARPFKVRVEQSLGGEQDSVVLYRLVSIFAFYASKILPEMSAESEIVQTLEELLQLTLNIFFSGLGTTVARILSKMGTPDYDLLPVPAVHQALLLLKEVLEAHDATASSSEEGKARFDKIIATVVDPLYRAIQVAATQLHSPIDVAVYTLNCLSAIHSLLILYPFTDKRIEMAQALMEGHEDVLISEEASAVMSSTRLISIYQKAAAHDNSQGPLSAISEADPSSVRRALEAFDQFLSQPNSCRIDQTARISNARVRERVHSKTVDNIVAAFAVVRNKITDPANKYEGIEVKTIEQVRELLK